MAVRAAPARPSSLTRAKSVAWFGHHRIASGRAASLLAKDSPADAKRDSPRMPRENEDGYHKADPARTTSAHRQKCHVTKISISVTSIMCDDKCVGRIGAM